MKATGWRVRAGLAMAAILFVPLVVSAQDGSGGSARPQTDRSPGETYQHEEERPVEAEAAEQDLDFANLAARDAHTIVKVGTYALGQIEDEQVHQLAQALVETAETIIERLNEITQGTRVEVPQSAGDKGEQLYHRFTGNWDDGLDLLYATQMDILLKKQISVYDLEAEQGQDPELKQLAQEMLPRLREHQERAADLQERLHEQQSTITGDR